MGNALNRQRYLMAQGYTYKVLVNITRGIDPSVIEKAKGLKVLMDDSKIKEMLSKVGVGVEVHGRRWK